MSRLLLALVMVMGWTVLLGGVSGVQAAGSACIGTTCYPTIQAAIDAATLTNTLITIGPGTYDEHLTVNKTVILQGSGQSSTFVDGTQNGTVVTVTSGVSPTIEDLTIQHGLGTGANGANGTTDANGNGTAGGAGGDAAGGVLNHGTLTLSQVTVSNNTAAGGIGGTGGPVSSSANTEGNGGNGGAAAGGILNLGSLTMNGSTITVNLATGGDGGGAGGILCYYPSTLPCGTAGIGGTGGDAAGGIENQSQTNIGQSTITSNTASAGVGGSVGPIGPASQGVAGDGGFAAGGLDNSPAATLNLGTTEVDGNSATGGTGGDGGTSVPGGAGGGGGTGAGGVVGGGSVTITNSGLSNNTGTGGKGGEPGGAEPPGVPGGGGLTAGGVFVESVSASLTNDTLSNNTGHGGQGASGGSGGCPGNAAGGLYNWTGKSALTTLTNLTIARNTADAPATPLSCGPPATTSGGINTTYSAGTITMSNTILAKNPASTDPDCAGTMSSTGGHNLIKNPTGCTLTGTTTGNILNSDPFLSSLANNGGPTLTRALLAGSPALGQANTSLCPATDQRGTPRNTASRGQCDIGAYDTGSGRYVLLQTTAGWNLVGGLGTIWSDVITTWSWNAGTGTWSHTPNGATGLWEESNSSGLHSVEVEHCTGPVTVAVVAHRWNMVGDPCDVPASLPSTTQALWWDPVKGRYVPITSIPAGAGAWVKPASNSLVLTPS